MKKKGLLILTFIISFILYTNIVSAATELTCIYEKSSGQVAVKIVQYKDGAKKVFTNTQEKKPSADSENWWLIGNVSFASDKELNQCPEYMSFAGSPTKEVTFSSNAKSGYAKLLSSENNTEDKHISYKDEDHIPGEKSIMEDEITSGKWIVGCQYKKINDDEYLYLYFNETEIRLVKNENVLPKNPEGQAYSSTPYTEFSDVQLSRVIKEYNTNGGCPINIYKNSITTWTEDLQYVYSLDRESIGSSLTTYVFIKSTDGKPDSKPINPTDCNQLLGKDVINFINEIMKWVRIFVPILLIGLGILDFTKAAFQKNEEDMKKIREKFIKRIIAAVLVFLAPIFINLLLELANSAWDWINPKTCIK